MNNTGRHWYLKWWGILLLQVSFLLMILFTASLFYAIEFFRSGSGLPPALKEADPAVITLLNGDGRNYWIGAGQPVITIVQFADFSCPVCADSFPTLRELSIKYNDKVKVIFRNYPAISENSATLALAAHCAGEQGLFWPMHDALYLNQGVNGQSALSILAQRTGADAARYTDCLESQKYLSVIQKDYADAQALGVNATPTWFINGHKIEGNVPYSIFEEMLNMLLD